MNDALRLSKGQRCTGTTRRVTQEARSSPPFGYHGTNLGIPLVGVPRRRETIAIRSSCLRNIERLLEKCDSSAHADVAQGFP